MRRPRCVLGNLAAGLENLGDDVNALMCWDAGTGPIRTRVTSCAGSAR
ncbi:hypothetical protein J2Z30_003283 [Streptomyces iranensis]|uniref:Uncharacterized protein n=1 Tax=Streptomyces iranensis TaxID=576784 RepID=A0ABS4MSM3_9ACTN|nr:hypothetical protein [Streptomyces iranensis]